MKFHRCDKCGNEMDQMFVIKYSVGSTGPSPLFIGKDRTGVEKEFEVCGECITQFNNFVDATVTAKLIEEMRKSAAI